MFSTFKFISHMFHICQIWRQTFFMNQKLKLIYSHFQKFNYTLTNYFLGFFWNSGSGIPKQIQSQGGCNDKIGFITCENIRSMVEQTFELKRTGDSITAVNLLKLLAVLCSPGIYLSIYLSFYSIPSYPILFYRIL